MLIKPPLFRPSPRTYTERKEILQTRIR